MPSFRIGSERVAPGWLLLLVLLGMFLIARAGRR
jgi:hypothetical protein